MISSKDLFEQEQEGGDNEIEIYQIYLQIEPTSLISSMSEDQFREWLCTNEYGIVEEKPDVEYLKEILKILSPLPHMRNYENIVLELLIKGSYNN